MVIFKMPERSFEIRNLRYKKAVIIPQSNPPMQPIIKDNHHIQPFNMHIPLNEAPIRKEPSGVISGKPITLNDVMVPNAKTEYSSPTINDAQHKFKIMLLNYFGFPHYAVGIKDIEIFRATFVNNQLS